MTKRTRLFLGVACGILVAGLGTGLVAAYVGGFQNLVVIGSNGPDELAYVPQDAQMVAYANIREIMSSDLRQRLRELQPASPEAPRRFQDETGINVETDIDYVLAAAGGAGNDSNQDRPLMLARGRFDTVRIEGLLRERGGAIEEYRGKRVLTQPGAQFSVAFVEPDLAAVGNLAAVKRAIDTKAGAVADVTGNADVMRLVRDADNGSAWAVARFDTISTRLTGGLPPQLPPIEWFVVSSHVDGGIRGTMYAETRDEASAQNLQDVLRGMMALARLQAGQQADLSAFVDSLELSGQGKTVTLGFSVPAEMIDKLAAKRLARPGAPSEPLPPAQQPAPSTPAF